MYILDIVPDDLEKERIKIVINDDTDLDIALQTYQLPYFRVNVWRVLALKQVHLSKEGKWE